MKFKKENSVSAPVQPGPRPKCPTCGCYVQFELLYPEAKGIVATCAKGCRFPLMNGLEDCAAFFPVAAPSADMEQEILGVLRDEAGYKTSGPCQIGLIPRCTCKDCRKKRLNAAIEQIESLRRRVPAQKFSQKWSEDAFVILAGLKEAVVWELAPAIMKEINRLVEEILATTQGTPEGI